jgi:hypothetical protein
VQGYSVVTSDDHRAGQVVDEQDELLIVEFGTLRKQKHVLPKAFAHERDGEETVAATVTWDILKDSPTVDGDGAIDMDAVAEHYGLADHFEETTEGYGENIPYRDPAYGPDEAARAGGVDTAEQERVAIREELADTSGRAPAPHVSPGITGGDRYRDAPGAKPAHED